MEKPARRLLPLIALFVPVVCAADGFTIDPGILYVVFPDENISFSNVKVDGTLQNHGAVTITGGLTNNSLVVNYSSFESRGEFDNYGSVDNAGGFTNSGYLTNHVGSFFLSDGVYVDFGAGRFTNHGTATFNELDVLGRFDNYGQLITTALPGGGNGVHQISGVLDNHGGWFNSGAVEIGNRFDTAEVYNGGLIDSFGDVLVSANSRLISTGEIGNAGTLQVEGELVNDGALVNTGTLIVEDLFVPDAASISGNGFLVNRGLMRVTQHELEIGGTWVNSDAMFLTSNDVRIDGELRNESRLGIAGDVEIVDGAVLSDAGDEVSIGGTLVNRGDVESGGVVLEAEQVDNYGNVSVASYLYTVGYRQFEGDTQVGGTIAINTTGMEVYGGSVGGDGRIQGHVTIYGGALVTDAGGLDIEGNLDLQDDATFMATIGADEIGVDVTGTALLGGTLQIAFADGLAITAGDQWIIATAASFQGAFADVLWPALPGIGFEAFVDSALFPNALVVQAVQAVPLPAPVFLLSGALLVMARLRRVVRLR